jgi:hypothetical protein
MTIRFASARLKLKRAQRHIAELKESIHRFLNENPHSFEIKKDADGNFGISALPGREVPAEFSPIIGDAFHNLRSALDHLAAELVRMNGHRPTRYTGFPMGDTKASFDGYVAEKLKGASNVMLAIVRAVEPYERKTVGNYGDGVELEWLSHMDIKDKHLLLLTTVGVATLKDVRVIFEGQVRASFGSLQVSGNDRVNVATFAGFGDDVHLEADPNATLEIRFKDTPHFQNEPVVHVLERMLTKVAIVIDRFERTLFPSSCY